MPALTRGPLPPRVYWVRRAALLGTALLLVVGIARILGGGSDASSDPAAQLSADQPVSPSVTTSAPTSSGSEGKSGGKAGHSKGHHKSDQSEAPVLAAPEGTCADDDVAVTPQIDGAVAGRDVDIVLQLRTLEATACTWQVSHESVMVKITSGADDIWSSRQCPRAIPTQDVVVRKDATTKVSLTWTGKRSEDSDCTRFGDWAMPGYYHVAAAALAGEPSDLQFELATPTSETITKTKKPHPKNDPQDEKSPSGGSSPSGGKSGKSGKSG